MAFPSRYPGHCSCGLPISIGEMICKDATTGKYVHTTCIGVAPVAVMVRHDRRQAADDVERWAAKGLLTVAGMDPDRASVNNGVGFSKHDGDFGHAMAERIAANQDMTEKQWAAVVKLATKYRRQIGPMPAPGSNLDSCLCGGVFEFSRSCGAKVCNVCREHKGLARCYCGWSASGMDGYAELVEMGETIEPD